MFFLCGGDKNNHCYLIAFSLNEDVDLIKEKVLPGAKSVSALRRHNEGDILFVGAFKVIYVVFYHQKQFHLLKEVPLPIERPTRDLAFNPHKSELYSVHDYEKGAVIYFEENNLANRNPNNKTPPIQRPKRRLGQAPPPPPAQRVVDPTPYDPLNQGYLTYDERMKLVKKPPTHAGQFKDYNVKQIQLPNSKTSVTSSQAAENPSEPEPEVYLLWKRPAQSA